MEDLYDAMEELGKIMSQLKKAGFTSFMLEHIASAPNNEPAKAMLLAYIKNFGAISHPKLEILKQVKFTVPKDFSLSRMQTEFYRQRWHFDEQITDVNFKASAPLIPGSIKTAVFVKIKKGEWVAAVDIFNYVQSWGGHLPNATGLAQAWEELKGVWPKNIWIAGFDCSKNLLREESSSHRLATLTRNSNRGWDFNLGYLIGGCDDTGGFLFFLD